jgi:hypothetical protein
MRIRNSPSPNTSLNLKGDSEGFHHCTRSHCKLLLGFPMVSFLLVLGRTVEPKAKAVVDVRVRTVVPRQMSTKETVWKTSKLKIVLESSLIQSTYKSAMSTTP